MRPTLEDEWDLEPWEDDPDGVDAHYIRESQRRRPKSRHTEGSGYADVYLHGPCTGR